MSLAMEPAVRDSRTCDVVVAQNWDQYSGAEHGRWDSLFARQMRLLQGRACTPFLRALENLQLSKRGIPDFAQLNARLLPHTGWQVVAVPGWVEDRAFFELLASRRFPAGGFIRGADQMDYLEEPDVFHDVFGHVPMLADPLYANFMQRYGEAGLKAAGADALRRMARLYWYTVEFGLIREAGELRLFGAGIVSSASESVYALDSPLPHRLAFDPGRVMRTAYKIDELQRCYFVLDDFAQLLDLAAAGFETVYVPLMGTTDIDPAN